MYTLKEHTANSDFQLSPSITHKLLTNGIVPSMHYSGDNVVKWQNKLRSRLYHRLGYGQMPKEKCNLNIRSLWKQQHSLGTIEKLIFTSEIGSDVPAYLCIPNSPRKNPCPIFICLQGHTTGMHLSIGRSSEDETKEIKVEGDREYALTCFQHGIASLCIEQRSFGERREQLLPNFRNGCSDAASQAIMLGRTLVAERVYDVQRSIDLLDQYTRDLDLDEIGILGTSHGGLITMYSTALLGRIKLAMPACSSCTYRDSIMAMYHCPDTYIPGLLLDAEVSDILGLIAPRPLVIIAGQEDIIFPIDGVKETFKELSIIYQNINAEDNCRLVIGPDGHRFYARIGWNEMIQFVDKQQTRAAGYSP